MTAELQEKTAAKYDVQLELEVREWMEAVISDNGFPGDDFHEGLKDGQYLCL